MVGGFTTWCYFGYLKKYSLFVLNWVCFNFL
jgi:hypothetical protein